MKRFSLLFLVISLLLVSCQAPDPITNYLDHAHGYSPDAIPEDLLDRITQAPINLMGEKHYVNQFEQFFIDMIPGIYERGVRRLGLEVAVSDTPMLQYYVTGKIEPESYRKPPNFRLFERLIEAVRAFNLELIAQGKSDDLMDIIAFDMDLTVNDHYSNLVRQLKQYGLGTEFFQYPYHNQTMIDEGVTTGLPADLDDSFRWLTGRADLAYTLVNDKLKNSQDIGDMYQAEIADFREEYIVTNLAYYADQLKDNQKLLAVIGSGHASKAQHPLGDMADGFRSAAVRLMEDHSRIVSTTTFESQTIVVGAFMTKVEIHNQMRLGEVELFQKAIEQYPNQNIWVDLSGLPAEGFDVDLVAESEEYDQSKNNGQAVPITKAYDMMVLIPTSNIDIARMLQIKFN